MKLTNKQKNDLHRVCSGHFLTAPYPTDWPYLNDGDLTYVVSTTKWEPFEEWSSDQLINLIEDVYQQTLRFIEEQL